MPHRAQDLTELTPADLALTTAAQALVGEAAYASLVLWDGQVLHGLRFSVIDERLVLLAPARLAQTVDDNDLACDDLACRVLVCGPVDDDRDCAAGRQRWVSLAFGGWAAAVPDRRREDVALGFVDRHVTADLFDLGERWTFLEIDLAELMLRTAETRIAFDADEAAALLAL